MQRGEITGRVDVNYWRLTPLFHQLFSNPRFTTVPIGTVVDLVQYGCSSLATEEPIGVPMLRMNNLQNDGWDLSELKYILMSEEELDRYRLEPGDLLFNRTNSKELVGKCDVFGEPGNWVFASYLIRVRLDSAKVLPQFASDFLNTRAGRLQIDRLSRQIIGMTNINAEELKEILLPVPPDINTQEKLVSAMNEARAARQTKLASATALLADLDSFILATLDLAPPPKEHNSVFAVRVSDLSRRIDAYSNQSRFGKLFAYIHGTKHEVKPFNQLASRIFSGTTPLAKGDAYVVPPNGVRFIRSGEITHDGEVSPTSEVYICESIHNGMMQRSQLEKGDLLIAIVGATIGAVGIFNGDEQANINQAIAAVRLGDESISPEFACLYLRSCIGQALLDYFKRPVARANINLEEIGEIPVLIPSRKLQCTIVSESHRRRKEARRLRAEAEAGWQSAKRWFEEQLLGSQEL